MERVCVLGLGYIGLPTASLLATKGFSVLGVDVDPDVVGTINRGDIHIVEPDLDILVKAAVQSGSLKASTEPAAADIFIIAVPTPFKPGHIPNLEYVDAATHALAPHLRPGNLVILESTSPVGTTERIRELVAQARPDLFTQGKPSDRDSQIFFAHCPERVLPGHILRELVGNDRIVGGVDPGSTDRARDFYRSFVSGEILSTDARTAEMCKLAENSFRDLNIAFANELSVVCDRLSINIWDLIRLANRHPRVNILQPGPGVGGHCIAVDPWFIVHSAPRETRLIRTAREVNDAKPMWVVEKVVESASGLPDPVIGCLGLSFKADIDDLRESPALWITRELLSRRVGRIMACEPNLTRSFKEFPLYDLDSVIKEADILLLLVDHKVFRKIDPVRLREKVVIDTRGIWSSTSSPLQ